MQTGRKSRGRRDAGAFSSFQHAEFFIDAQGGDSRFVFLDTLSAHTLGEVEARVTQAVVRAGGRIILDLTGLDRLDTAGALFLNQTAVALVKRGCACVVLNEDPSKGKLLEKSVLPEEEKRAVEKPYSHILLVCNALGGRVVEGVNTIGRLVDFLGQFLVTVGRIMTTPLRMRWTSLVFHMEQTGLRAVPIVALLTFLIGMVVAYMGVEQLARFGAQSFAVNLLEVTVMREMAVLITSIVVAGRSSSSFTAQIGAMQANEEIAALRSMGLDPNVLLVVPRVFALVFTLPMLVFIADMMSLLGGAVAIWYTTGMTFGNFFSQLQDVAKFQNFFVGIVKTPIFALSIGLVGCFQGLRATSSAESVGFLTTVSVVQSIFIVIVFDALFAIFFSTIGI